MRDVFYIFRPLVMNSVGHSWLAGREKHASGFFRLADRFPSRFSFCRRLAEMEQASQQYAAKLVGPGDMLSGRVRASVAKEAYASLDDRDVWKQLKASPKDAGLLDRMLAIEHTFTGECSPTLACVVHAVLHLQLTTNPEWYNAVLERVAAELIADGEMDAKATFEDKAMCLTEIIAVAAGGAGLAAFYKALEKPLPPLPASASGSPLFKGLRDFYTGKIVVTSGYGYQLNEKEASKISEAALKKAGWTSMAEYKPNLESVNPFVKLSLTPYSSLAQQDWMEVQYIPPVDVSEFAAKPPPSRCLSRPDLEVVAAAYAGAVTCHF
ncbi:rlmJ [Symbiodinium natans]|uniref:RlmJ protein n=1 Tax=Symbiodinium natans TaxID=878477 RepID=A0A812PRE6_9DINO|nr:rlmJ [Symbiodinium natans]